MRLRLTLLVAIALALAAAPASAQIRRDRIENALSKKVTYDFKDMALADVVRALSADAEVNIILDDSRVTGIDPLQKLTLTFNNMSIGSILTWVTRRADLQWCVQDEAIFITTYNRLDQAAKLQIEKRNSDRRTQASKTWLPAMQAVLAKNYTVTFDYKSLGECRNSLQALLGVNVILAPNVDPDTS